MKSLRFRSRNHWDRLEHNNWSTGNPALSSDFGYSEYLGEQVVREWLAGKKSQSARESYGVFSHRIRKSSAKKRGACELRNGTAGLGTIVKKGE